MPFDYGYFDGACEPQNPGGAGGWGFVLFGPDGAELKTGYGHLKGGPNMTNNVAEYVAAGLAVKAYRDLGRPGPLVLHGDSQLVIRQMSGRWKAIKGAYVRYHDRLRELLSEVEFRVEWRWIPRDQNQLADDLSKKALAAAGVRIRHGRKP